MAFHTDLSGKPCSQLFVLGMPRGRCLRWVALASPSPVGFWPRGRANAGVCWCRGALPSPALSPVAPASSRLSERAAFTACCGRAAGDNGSEAKRSQEMRLETSSSSNERSPPFPRTEIKKGTVTAIKSKGKNAVSRWLQLNILLSRSRVTVLRKRIRCSSRRAGALQSGGAWDTSDSHTQQLLSFTFSPLTRSVLGRIRRQQLRDRGRFAPTKPQPRSRRI
nr:centrosomal protein kizuna isoform X2 [Columba livia]